MADVGQTVVLNIGCLASSAKPVSPLQVSEGVALKKKQPVESEMKYNFNFQREHGANCPPPVISE